MNYRLSWMNHWSEKRESDDPRVLVQYTREPDGWYEHDYFYYFIADNDDEARAKARTYIEQSGDNIDIWSLYSRDSRQVIATEEDIV